MAGGTKNGHRDDMDRAANGRADMSDPTLLHYIQTLEKRQDRHESDCGEERRESNRQRDSLHRKVDDGFARVDGKMDALAGKVEGSFSRIHERLNDVVKASHAGEAKTWDWRLKLAGWVLAGGAALVGYLLVYGRPWVNLP